MYSIFAGIAGLIIGIVLAMVMTDQTPGMY